MIVRSCFVAVEFILLHGQLKTTYS